MLGLPSRVVLELNILAQGYALGVASLAGGSRDEASIHHGVRDAPRRVTILGGMERDRFEELVEQELERLPPVFRERLTNVAIIIEDAPPVSRRERNGLLLGLFHGIPRTEKSVFFSAPPDHIYLYQRSIEAVCRTEKEVHRQVRATLLHEIGHYFGLSERELRDV